MDRSAERSPCCVVLSRSELSPASRDEHALTLAALCSAHPCGGCGARGMPDRAPFREPLAPDLICTGRPAAADINCLTQRPRHWRYLDGPPVVLQCRRAGRRRPESQVRVLTRGSVWRGLSLPLERVTFFFICSVVPCAGRSRPMTSHVRALLPEHGVDSLAILHHIATNKQLERSEAAEATKLD